MAWPDGTSGGTEQERALHGLVEQEVISADQAAAVRDALGAARPQSSRVRWAEITGYLGGGLLLAGIIALVATSWAQWGDGARIGVLAFLTAAATIGGVLVAGGPQALAGRRHRVPVVRRRITGVLFALAAVSAAFAVDIVGGEAFKEGSFISLTAVLVGLIVAAAGYIALPSAVGIVACWAFSVITMMVIMNDPFIDGKGFEQGLSLITLGAVWVAVALTGLLTPRSLGLGLGAGTALVGAQVLSVESLAWSHWTTLAIAAVCLALYQWERAAVLLVAGIVAVTVGVPELVWNWTDGRVGAAAILLLAGAVLLAASGIGIRVHRNR